MRTITLCLGLAVLLAPAAGAQALTVERDGDEVTITRPDGTVERLTIGEEAEFRVRSKNGPLVVEREDRRGGPRAFAFRLRPEDGPFRVDPFGFEGFDLDVDADSMFQRALRFRGDPGRISPGPFEHEGFLPWPGFGQRGVEPVTRDEIAEGERQSRTLARQLRRAEGAERARLTRELRETLERTFDLKQRARRERADALREDADRLREELAQLEEELREREAARGEIVERRQQELLGERDGLDW